MKTPAQARISPSTPFVPASYTWFTTMFRAGQVRQFDAWLGSDAEHPTVLRLHLFGNEVRAGRAVPSVAEARELTSAALRCAAALTDAGLNVIVDYTSFGTEGCDGRNVARLSLEVDAQPFYTAQRHCGSIRKAFDSTVEQVVDAMDAIDAVEVAQ